MKIGVPSLPMPALWQLRRTPMPSSFDSQHHVGAIPIDLLQRFLAVHRLIHVSVSHPNQSLA
jgi:hypothetical protein